MSWLRINMHTKIITVFLITDCINDVCSIRVYNIDDVSYAFINQQYVTTQLSGPDTDFLDVAPYLRNGLNRFTFLTYNGGGAYTWGFQIVKNGHIVFDDTEGLRDSVPAYNDMSSENQFVYNKTISINVTQCATMTSTSSTGELFACCFVLSVLECTQK